METHVSSAQTAIPEPIGAAEYDTTWETLRKLQLRYPPGHTLCVLASELQRVVSAELQLEHGQTTWRAFRVRHGLEIS